MYSKLCSLLYFYTIYSTLTNSILPLTTRIHSHLVRHTPFYSLFYISTPFDFNFVSHIYPLHQIYLSKNFYFAFHAATNPCLNFFNFRQAQSLDPRLLEPLKKSWYVVLYDEIDDRFAIQPAPNYQGWLPHICDEWWDCYIPKTTPYLSYIYN